MQALHSAWATRVCGTAPNSDDLVMSLADPVCTLPTAIQKYLTLANQDRLRQIIFLHTILMFGLS